VGAVEMKVKRLNWEKIDVVHENSVWAQVSDCVNTWQLPRGQMVETQDLSIQKHTTKTHNRLLQITMV